MCVCIVWTHISCMYCVYICVKPLLYILITERFFESRVLEISSSSSVLEEITLSFTIPNDDIALQGVMSDTLSIQSVSDQRVSIDTPRNSQVFVTDDESKSGIHCDVGSNLIWPVDY